MKVKLIQPRMLKRPMDTDLKIRMSPHLGLLTVANIIRHECEVTIENENIRELDFNDVPDLVGIAVTVDVLPRAIEIAAIYRKKGAKVIAGGIHITTAFDTVPKEAFDSLCIGFAENTWPQIIEDAKHGRLQSQYVSAPLESGDDITSPAYDLIDKTDYLWYNVVSTSRSCPHKCDFCYNSSGTHQYINRNIEDVLGDIKRLGTKHIMFIDDNFIGNISWTKQFLERIKPLKLNWNAAVTMKIGQHPELMDLMKETGCQSLFIGFESISPQSLSSVHKMQNNREEFERLINELHKRGIMVNASFVFGLDGDTPETFKNTLDWIISQKIDTITSHIVTPYPGTEFYKRMEAQNRIFDYDLSKYNTSHVVVSPLGMSKEELEKGYLWIYKELYSIKNIFRRLPKTISTIPAYLTFNFFYRRFGQFTSRVCELLTYKRIGLFAEKLSRYM